MKEISYERRIYESVDDGRLSPIVYVILRKSKKFT